jgi:hypothetical protein
MSPSMDEKRDIHSGNLIMFAIKPGPYSYSYNVLGIRYIYVCCLMISVYKAQSPMARFDPRRVYYRNGAVAIQGRGKPIIRASEITCTSAVLIV